MAIKASVTKIDFTTSKATVVYTNHNPFSADEMQEFSRLAEGDAQVTEIISNLNSYEREVTVPYMDDGSVDHSELLTRIDAHCNALMDKVKVWSGILNSKKTVIPNIRSIQNMEFSIPTGDERKVLEAFSQFSSSMNNQNAEPVTETPSIPETTVVPEPTVTPDAPLAARPKKKKRRK